jgi:hypothetical protein
MKIVSALSFLSTPHPVIVNLVYVYPWTNITDITLQTLTGRALGRVFNFRSGCMYTMHLLPSVTIQPNLELKTRFEQLLGSLPLVIALPGISCNKTKKFEYLFVITGLPLPQGHKTLV